MDDGCDNRADIRRAGRLHVRVDHVPHAGLSHGPDSCLHKVRLCSVESSSQFIVIPYVCGVSGGDETLFRFILLCWACSP